MEAFWQSFLLVALAELGDKSQLLALVLTLRYRRPGTILAAIFCAALVSHSLAAYLGGYLSSMLSGSTLRMVLAGSFAVFALWLLLPERGQPVVGPTSRLGPFLTTFFGYLLAEMGDKSQLATVALGARYQAPVLVALGTTLGMLFSDSLAVYFGGTLVQHLPMHWIRRAAAALFAGFGLAILVGF